MKTSKTAKQAWELSNLRQIKVSFVGPTNYRGARVCIFEPARMNDDPTNRKYFSYSYKYGNILEQAYDLLKFNGWNIICRTSDKDSFTFLCDNWSDEYLEIKNLKFK